MAEVYRRASAKIAPLTHRELPFQRSQTKTWAINTKFLVTPPTTLFSKPEAGGLAAERAAWRLKWSAILEQETGADPRVAEFQTLAEPGLSLPPQAGG